MKHFVKKHRHHFGLWLISAIVLVASTFWLKSVDKQLAGLDESAARLAPLLAGMSDQSSIAGAPASLSPAPPSNLAALTNQGPTEEKASGAETSLPNVQPAENLSPPALYSSIPDKSSQSENKIKVSFKIIAPAWTKEFNIDALSGSTVYEAMLLLHAKGLLPIVFKQFAGLGAFVQSINGLENSAKNNQFWIYYINGKAATLGISSIKLNPNDYITWKYEESKF